jgi:ATP-dependent RNA helicase RhlB
MSQTHLTDTRFDSFDIDPRILLGLKDAGFVQCTPIQAETLPIALAGRDVAGQAQTGTGKTAAFLVAVFQRLLAQTPERSHRIPHPRAVMLAPTRELAVQIHKDAQLLARHCGFRLGLVYGGTGYQQQRDDVAAGVDILIGTPGRLIDYLRQDVFSLKGVEALVIDEADRMFDLGFIKDIRFLLRRMPPPQERLGCLFSATLSFRVMELAYEHMNDPQLVEIEPDQITCDRVRQSCYMVGNDEKIPLLIGLLRHMKDARVMVFVNMKREAERVWGYLEGNGLRSAVLSGDVPQTTRLKLLKRFQEGELPILVATDVAARGLHIPDVTHVINYDLPEDAEDYVHRIGRTARAGADGDAISFACETYAFVLPDVERFIGAKIATAPIEPEMLAEVDPRSRVRVQRTEEERARLARDRDRARDRQGPGHGRDRPGQGRPQGHGHGHTHGHEAGHGPGHGPGTGDRPPAAAPTQDQTRPPTADGEAPKPRRRRRRPAPGATPTQA